MGLDKKLASSRVNRYEAEVIGIDLDGLGKLAEVLGVPMATWWHKTTLLRRRC